MNDKLKLAVTVATLVMVGIIAYSPIGDFTLQQKAMIGISILAIVYWVTECVPIPVTGIIIILLEVVFGVFPLAKGLSYIASDVNMLILAGLVISIALSKYQLDRLLSLKILSFMGEKTDRIVLGMMIATALLSMWIPNTAAAAIMAPVAVGMLELIRAEKGRSNAGKIMMIGVAYAATIGGIGTPVGTPPVPITIRNVKEATGYDITFAKWMAWGVPIALVLTIIAWKLLTLFYPPEVKSIPGGKSIVDKELEKIGKLNKQQKTTLAIFGIAVVLWLMDSFYPILPNWTYIASLIIIVLYLIPGVGTLSWDEVSREADWGVLFLVAGGLALGGGLRETGIVKMLADAIATRLAGSSPYLVNIVIALVAGFSVTVFCSITATSSAFVPIAIAIAGSLGMDARFTGIVAGIASCFAFLLPANTPPNAIAYSYGYFKNYEMAKVGLVLTLLSSIVLIAFMPMITLLTG
uniref:DASS family sodium-coupled anion symporter n=1 Tax=Thermosphaera aggregans TaxID=54254 RepID=A0A7C2FEE8_9CREN